MSIAKGGRILGKLFGCLVLFAAHESFAEALVDPDVMAVVEGGYWREDGIGEGSYRIIVVSQGFEHVSSRVVAEWKLAGARKAGPGLFIPWNSSKAGLQRWRARD